MLSFLTLIPIVFIILYLALIFESTGFALLGFSVAAMGVLSFVVLLWQVKRVSVDLSVPLRTAQKAQSFGIRIKIQNHAVLPIGRIGLTIRYGERKAEKREKITFMIDKVRQGKNELTRSLSIHGAGDYEFIARKVRVYDPFGLFFLSIRNKSITHVMILPEISEVPVRLGEAVKQFYGEPVAYDDLRAGNDPSETFGVREFRDGDKLQRVHWKLSARTEELVVKEDAQPKCCPVILLMPEGADKNGEILDYMASLSFTLMDQHCGHYMVWQSESRGDLIRARVEDEESFYYALLAYLQDGSAKIEDDRLERYREKYKAEPYLHSVLADEKGEISVDGEEAVTLQSVWEELILN